MERSPKWSHVDCLFKDNWLLLPDWAFGEVCSWKIHCRLHADLPLENRHFSIASGPTALSKLGIQGVICSSLISICTGVRSSAADPLPLTCPFPFNQGWCQKLFCNCTSFLVVTSSRRSTEGKNLPWASVLTVTWALFRFFWFCVLG